MRPEGGGAPERGRPAAGVAVRGRLSGGRGGERRGTGRRWAGGVGAMERHRSIDVLEYNQKYTLGGETHPGGCACQTARSPSCPLDPHQSQPPSRPARKRRAALHS